MKKEDLFFCFHLWDFRLIIRGRPEDFIVACTKDKTYQVKEVESSNSLVLLPNLVNLENSKNKETGEFLQIVVCFLNIIEEMFLDSFYHQFTP